MIPKINWPVPPMLKSPTRKVRPIPSPAAISVALRRRVSVMGRIAFSKVSASALLSPEAKILRLKIDETCAKRIGAAITGQPALPNSQANSPSLYGVLVLLVELGRECPEALDRYLPALIKLLSRLTQELNSVSTAQQQQRILQQQSSRNRSQSSKLKEENAPVAEYGSVAHCVA